LAWIDGICSEGRPTIIIHAMTPEDTSHIQRACERLVVEAAYRIDHQDYAGFAALFVPEVGTLSRPGGAPLVGPEAIRRAYEARPASRITRHLCTNIRITVESAQRARGLSYVLLFSGNTAAPPPDHFGWTADSPQRFGEFEDDFEHTVDGWRIRSRQARFLLHT
jgi:SnoaL-like domain